MHGGEPCACLNPFLVGTVGKKANVVGNGPGKKLIVLHHDAEYRSVILQPCLAYWFTVEEYLAAGRLKKAAEKLEQRGFASTGRANNGDRFPGRNPQVDVPENPRLM